MSKDKYLFKDKFTADMPLTTWELDKAIRRAPAKEKNPAWLTKNEKLLLWCLNSHDGGDGIYPTYPAIKRETGINSDPTIRHLIKVLVIKGFLEYVPGKFRGNSSEYKITVPLEVQRVVKTSRKGNQYVDFVYPEQLPARFFSLPVLDKGKKRTSEPLPSRQLTTAVMAVVTTAVTEVQDKTIEREKGSDNGTAVPAEPTTNNFLSSPGVPNAAPLRTEDDQQLSLSSPGDFGLTSVASEPSTTETTAMTAVVPRTRTRTPPGYIWYDGQLITNDEFNKIMEGLN